MDFVSFGHLIPELMLSSSRLVIVSPCSFPSQIPSLYPIFALFFPDHPFCVPHPYHCRVIQPARFRNRFRPLHANTHKQQCILFTHPHSAMLQCIYSGNCKRIKPNYASYTLSTLYILMPPVSKLTSLPYTGSTSYIDRSVSVGAATF